MEGVICHAGDVEVGHGLNGGKAMVEGSFCQAGEGRLSGCVSACLLRKNSCQKGWLAMLTIQNENECHLFPVLRFKVSHPKGPSGGAHFQCLRLSDQVRLPHIYIPKCTPHRNRASVFLLHRSMSHTHAMQLFVHHGDFLVKNIFFNTRGSFILGSAVCLRSVRCSGCRSSPRRACGALRRRRLLRQT